MQFADPIAVTLTVSFLYTWAMFGVDYNAHVIEAILTQIAPALGWR